ncbi:hypothetical protein [Brucella anthropi]|uniref:hypothetical protein n=1 Tax=Brucella anthropi TaxID=529 RepID=UPI003D973BC8
MSADALRGMAAVLNIVGSLLLALRVKGLIDAIISWVTTHENNFRSYHEEPWFVVVGGEKWAKQAKRIWLFYLAFFLFGTAGMLQLIAIFV